MADSQPAKAKSDATKYWLEEQKRFTLYIQGENERLNRLIRNLYLHFQIEHYSERDLYDHICQEVAEYFRADGCYIYLVNHDEEPAGDKYSIKRWLALSGAFGPWRRALRQRYTRKRCRVRYQLRLSPPPDKSSMTRHCFEEDRPSLFTCGYDFREMHVDQSDTELRKDDSRQVVWFHDCLYNSSRSIMAAPLLREGEPAMRIGLIKVENRAPRGVLGFREALYTDTERSELFFPGEWGVAALRPYIHEIRLSVRKEGDAFQQLRNNVGWQQYFEDHPRGAKYFQHLLDELHRRWDRHDHKTTVKGLTKAYDSLAPWMEHLVECLVRVESWLQHLRHASLLLARVGAAPEPDRPAPSLFNIYNLSAARPSAAAAGEEDSALRPFDVLREAVWGCLSPARGETVGHLKRLVGQLDELKRKEEKARQAGGPVDKKVENDRADKEHEIEQLIGKWCRAKAEKVRDILGSKRSFEIVRCLDRRPPKWNFKGAFDLVLGDLGSVCRAVAAVGDMERDPSNYAMVAEEAELGRLSRQVLRFTAVPAGSGAKPLDARTVTAGQRAAKAMAAATMYADSFHEIDAERLVFIASHISQVLDNHLLHQARQYELGLDYELLGRLGLDGFGLELLDEMNGLGERIELVLRHILAREGFSQGDDAPAPPGGAAGLGGLLKSACDGGADPGDSWFRYRLLAVTGPASPSATQALSEIAHCATLADVSMEIEEETDGNRKTIRGIRFQPRAVFCPAGEDRMAEAQLIRPEAGDRAIALDVSLKRSALAARDVRAWWGAVKTLEDILKVLEITSGGKSHASKSAE